MESEKEIKIKLRKIRTELNAMPLKQRVALGGRGIKLLRTEHRLLCELERIKKVIKKGDKKWLI